MYSLASCRGRERPLPEPEVQRMQAVATSVCLRSIRIAIWTHLLRQNPNGAPMRRPRQGVFMRKGGDNDIHRRKLHGLEQTRTTEDGVGEGGRAPTRG